MKIGQKLYKYSYQALLEYEIFAILEKKDGVHYYATCLSCLHEEKCEIIIKFNTNKKLEYVSTLNENNKHNDWHQTTKSVHYHLSKEEARIDLLNRKIECHKTGIKENMLGIENRKKDIEKLEKELNNLIKLG